MPTLHAELDAQDCSPPAAVACRHGLLSAAAQLRGCPALPLCLHSILDLSSMLPQPKHATEQRPGANIECSAWQLLLEDPSCSLDASTAIQGEWQLLPLVLPASLETLLAKACLTASLGPCCAGQGVPCKVSQGAPPRAHLLRLRAGLELAEGPLLRSLSALLLRLDDGSCLADRVEAFFCTADNRQPPRVTWHLDL